MKLSEKQKEVIQNMRDGFDTLGYFPRIIGKRAVLYKGGVSKWSAMEYISHKTFQIILKEKLIKKLEVYLGIELYSLTELGKTIEL